METTGIIGIIQGLYWGDMGVSQFRDTFLGAPIVRTVVFWGLYWGPLF